MYQNPRHNFQFEYRANAKPHSKILLGIIQASIDEINRDKNSCATDFYISRAMAHLHCKSGKTKLQTPD